MDKISVVTEKKRSTRFLQVLVVCLCANVIGIALSGPKSTMVLATAVVLQLAILLASRFNITEKHLINSFLWVTTFEICALSALNNAVHDPMIIGYPLILMYAALFATPTMFVVLLVFMSLFNSALIFAILHDLWPAPVPKIRWQSVIAINLLFAVAALSSWFIARDYRQLINRLTRQITKLNRSRRKISALHKQDALTGLLNRESAAIYFNRLSKQYPALTVVFINLQKFKQINDAFGHVVGDKVLQHTAKRIKALLRNNEVACRFGGNEFVLILQTDEAREHELARFSALLTALTEELYVDGHRLSITTSFGISRYPQHEQRFEQLCLQADAAMYRARSEPNCTYLEYQPKWQTEHTAKLKLIKMMKQALVSGEFYLEYQPKYCLRTLSITSVEALVRWQSPELGLVMPARFINIAEESGLIEPLGLFVLEQACRDCQHWRSLGHNVGVAVNISAQQLTSGRLSGAAQRVLADSGLPASYLELELTESMLVEHTALVNEQISQLIALGVTFSIDDFGTGYSNLHYLSRFNMATLKIDRSFIRNLHIGEADYKLVQGIIGLARTLGLHTIAEGIETTEDLALLRQLDCDTGQGYFLSRPVRKEQLLLLFASSEAALVKRDEAEILLNNKPTAI